MPDRGTDAATAHDPGRHPGVPGARTRSTALLTQIAWFNRLRFGAAAGMILFIFAVELMGGVDTRLQLYLLVAATVVVNLGYLRYYPRLARASERRLRRHVDLQIAIDLVVLTGLLHYSGGVTNPFALFYLFHSFIAAMLLSIRAAVVVSLLSIALVTVLAFGEHGGWLQHWPMPLAWVDLRSIDALQLGVGLFAFALTLGFSIYFVAMVVHQLRAREEQLVGLSRQLAQSEKLASVGTLAAGVSHEINNPVGVIRNKAEILRYRIDDGDGPDELNAEVDAIEKHAQRIAEITAGLLAFSRKTPFERRRVGVAELVREVADLVRVPFDAAGVRLELALPTDAEPPAVDGSPNHLAQVLVNVLLNARDASARGDVVRIDAGAVDGEVRIVVVDEGDGIPAEDLDQIFDPFFTTKDVDRGTGLGLAITHGIVERHGGRIEVASEVGRGSSFTIVFPRHQGRSDHL